MVGVPARGILSANLLDLVRTRYGCGPLDVQPALEDSFNLNVIVRDGNRLLVVRVYRSWVTPARLAAVQRVREFLVEGGLPFATPWRTLDGHGWCAYGDQLVEVEEFVPSESYLRTFTHLQHAMPVLAKIHDRLARLRIRTDEPAPAPAQPEPPAAALTAPTANHVDAARTVDVVAAGVAAVRRAGLSPTANRQAAVAEELAARLRDLEAAIADPLPRQLVHGDFWDDNVRFRGHRVVLVTDLDFMGYRPRVDDLALTLFFANERLGRHDRSAHRIARLRAVVDAYDTAHRVRLTEAERHALPYAVVRTSLCFLAHLAHADADSVAEVVDRRGPAWVWGLAAVGDPAWQDAFV